MPTKICTKCGVEKDVGEFAIARSNKDGLQRWCRKCRKEHDEIVHPNRKHNKHYDDEHGKKTCRKCGVKKDISEFTKNKRSKDGISLYCRECTMEYQESNHPNMKHRAPKSKLPGMKTCSSCRIEKPIDAFSKSKNMSDGLSSWCKACVTEYYLNTTEGRRRIVHEQSGPGYKKCVQCGEDKPLEDFYYKSSGWLNTSAKCKDCIRSNRKTYRENNQEKVKESKRISYLKAHPPKPKVEKIKIQCGYCGTVFEVTQCNSNRKYCSHDCYAKDHVGEKNGFFGKTHSEEFKEQQRILLTGHVESDDTKNKKRIANLKRYEDPKEHERTSEANKKRFEDPAQREIQRVNQIRTFEENPYLRDIVSKTFKNKKQSDTHRMKKGRAIRGEKNGCWKGGITPLHVQIRCCTKMSEWIQSVLKRDDYRDWFCGLKGTHGNPVEVHHIVRFSTIMSKYKIKTLGDAEACDELWDMNNGITLLRSSHKAYHEMWGR